MQPQRLFDASVEVGEGFDVGIGGHRVLVGDGGGEFRLDTGEIGGVHKEFKESGAQGVGSTAMSAGFARGAESDPTRKEEGENGDMRGSEKEKIRKRERLPVVPSPARPMSCASCAIRVSVFSSSGRELARMPSNMVFLISSGLGEDRIFRTRSVHHYPLSDHLSLGGFWYYNPGGGDEDSQWSSPSASHSFPSNSESSSPATRSAYYSPTSSQLESGRIHASVQNTYLSS